MKTTKASLVKKYQEMRHNIINPDGMNEWSDLGFDEKPEGYDSVDDYLEHGEDTEFDETSQTELRLIAEFLEDLARLS